MNKKKFLIFALTVVAALSLVGVTKKGPITNKLNTPALVKPKNNLSPVVVSINKASNNTQEKKSIQNEVVDSEFDKEYAEYQVFWNEINEKWNEELKNFLISLGQGEGLRMFNAYVESHKRFLKEQDRLARKYQKINAIKPLSEEQHDLFGAENSKNSKKANERNKKIFDQHYNAVKKLHKEFEESIQVYSRDQPIYFDLNFNK